MTGFARTDGQDEGYGWTFEVKSVNGRSLDIRCRMPPGFDALEAAARAEVPKHLKRGSVNVALTVTRAAAPVQLRINRDVLGQLLALADELGGVEKPRLDALLGIRGVVETI